MPDKRRVFIDSCVLISAATGRDDMSLRALEAIDDPDAEFVSSVFVQMETLPKSIFNKQRLETEFYEEFFKRVSVWVDASKELAQSALEESSKFGLGAIDLLHVVAAKSAGAVELITNEKPSRSIHRAKGIPVRSINS